MKDLFIVTISVATSISCYFLGRIQGLEIGRRERVKSRIETQKLLKKLKERGHI